MTVQAVQLQSADGHPTPAALLPVFPVEAKTAPQNTPEKNKEQIAAGNNMKIPVLTEQGDAPD